MRTRRTKKSCASVFWYVAIAVLGAQLLCDVTAVDIGAEAMQAFGVPALEKQVLTPALAGDRTAVTYRMGQGSSRRHGRIQAKVAHVIEAGGVSVLPCVLNAVGAGFVASVIQAALSAVGEPIENRVLVKRMKVMDAINDVSPAMMLNFFKTTLATDFLKFPFFEAIHVSSTWPIPPSLRGLSTGFLFTAATLPVTNYRYRKSMQLPIDLSSLYEAFLPTVIRDMVYGIIRNYSTIGLLAWNKGWSIHDPQVLFIVVIVGCLGSAPFNEWRGFLLQTKSSKIPFKEFFKPSNFLRSTSLGAFIQGASLAVGYWASPPVAQFVKATVASFKG